MVDIKNKALTAKQNQISVFTWKTEPDAELHWQQLSLDINEMRLGRNEIDEIIPELHARKNMV